MHRIVDNDSCIRANALMPLLLSALIRICRQTTAAASTTRTAHVNIMH